MKRICFTTALVLLITWALGFFIFRAGVFIHGLMIVAAIFCMHAVIINPKPTRTVASE